MKNSNLLLAYTKTMDIHSLHILCKKLSNDKIQNPLIKYKVDKIIEKYILYK